MILRVMFEMHCLIIMFRVVVILLLFRANIEGVYKAGKLYPIIIIKSNCSIAIKPELHIFFIYYKTQTHI